jgi:N6-adenosine-specific RNA methylase IME4
MLVAQFDQVNQKKWLAKAVKNNWTTRDLKHRLTLQKRLDRHQEIADEATTSSVEGPFPLIYADPPWEFSTYSWKGKEISPDKHYPTMDDDGIVNFMVNGRFVPELAHKDAALYIWCTSSNLVRALAVMEAWGFEYKTHAVWDKERTGTGYIFLNQHELLLYGTRGNIPAPMAIRSSVFQYPRGRHSAKPPEVREALDEMYPAFKKRNKIELFAREAVPDWTIDGYEAKDVA